MLVSVYGVSTLASVFQLVLMLIVFVALLFGAHYFTKWYAKSEYVRRRGKNISIVESQQLAPGKNLIIAKLGQKYVAFVLLKENAAFLTELSEEELDLSETVQTESASFAEIVKKMRKSGEQGVSSFQEVLKKVRKGDEDKHE